jgi:GNAT superfamily N-acetyltransferase
MAGARYVVRDAVAADCEQVHALIVELAEFEGEAAQVQLSAQRLELDLAQGRFFCLVAEEEFEAETQAASAPGALSQPLSGPPLQPPLQPPAQQRRGRIAGYALVFGTYSTWQGHGLWLEDLYVRPWARGAGLGSRLMREVCALALRRGCARLQWQALDWNTPALDFYFGAVGAAERVESGGAKWVNVIMRQAQMQAFLATGPEPRLLDARDAAPA